MAESNDKVTGILKQVFDTMPGVLDERQRRLLAASIAKGYGHGGITLVNSFSGMDIRTIRSGIHEIDSGEPSASDKVRKSGAGRPPLKKQEPELLNRIKEILENNTYGDPQKVICWTNLSLREISSLLKEQYGIDAGKDIVSRALEELGYSKQTRR